MGAEELKGRDIEEVLAEAHKHVKECEEAIVAAEGDDKNLDAEVEEAKKAMEAASAEVEATTHKETIALEKYKFARMEKAKSATGTTEAKEGRVEAQKAVKVLELEAQTRAKMAEFEAAKKAAEEA